MHRSVLTAHDFRGKDEEQQRKETLAEREGEEIGPIAYLQRICLCYSRQLSPEAGMIVKKIGGA